MTNNTGRFGIYGGRYVAETLIPALDELAAAYQSVKDDPSFHSEYLYYLQHYTGRPTPLYQAARLSEQLGGARIYLKREDLNHTGAHKINNTIGQILLAKRMGKSRIIAETGAGQHGVATATVCALFGMKCVIFMGEEDIRRQSLNVFRMRLLGASVEAVKNGTRTLKDATTSAIQDWVANVRDTYYLVGSVVGPHPYPTMVRDFQAIIGEEARRQLMESAGRLPTAIVACVGGGSNVMGIFHAFRADSQVRLIGVEAGGRGSANGEHAATLTKGKPGVLHGALSYLLQDDEGQVLPAHSISAGLDYPGVGPEHSYFKDSGRAEYVSVTDQEALAAFSTLTRAEGIIPALESAHAVAYACKLAPTLRRDDILLINISGRGDKDVMEVEKLLKEAGHE